MFLWAELCSSKEVKVHGIRQFCMASLFGSKWPLILLVISRKINREVKATIKREIENGYKLDAVLWNTSKGKEEELFRTNKGNRVHKTKMVVYCHLHPSRPSKKKKKWATLKWKLVLIIINWFSYLFLFHLFSRCGSFSEKLKIGGI